MPARPVLAHLGRAAGAVVGVAEGPAGAGKALQRWNVSGTAGPCKAGWRSRPGDEETGDRGILPPFIRYFNFDQEKE